MSKDNGKKILLIEDDVGVLDIISMFVEDMELGVEVLAASKSADAKKIFYNDDIDIVICDINLGEDIDGIDLYNEFLKSKSDLGFIFTSTDSEKLKRLSANSNLLMLKKPFGEEILKNTLKDMIKEKGS